MKAYRQGELLFVLQEVKNKEDLKRALENGKKTSVIAQGEATGHKHELADPSTAIVIDIEDENIWIDNDNPRYSNYQKILHTETGTIIKHPEHAPLHLPAGTYFIRTQREYDEEEDIRVRD